MQADAEAVGQAAADAGVALTELRPAGGGGLEQLFLTLTAGDVHQGGRPMTATTAPAAGAVAPRHHAPVRRPSLAPADRAWSCASSSTPGPAAGC